MANKGVKKPYIHFIGNNATDVTGSCTVVKYGDVKLCVDMGLIQTNNMVADYKANREQMKKIKPKTVHGVIITHCHSDHIGGLLLAVSQGMKAHIYVPQGSSSLIRVMLEDSVKIMMQDSVKMQNGGLKAPPLAELNDVEKVMQWIVEVPFNNPTEIVGGAKLIYYRAGHIIYSAQAVLEIKQGYITKRIGFTGDIGYDVKSVSVPKIEPLPRCNVVVGEATYSDKTRCYSMKKDRWYDEQVIKTAIDEYNKILIPIFSLQRTEDVLSVLEQIGVDCPVYLDSPLAERIYKTAWDCDLLYENTIGLHIIQSWEESQALQESNEHCIILASSGMLTAGRALCHLKTLLPNRRNCILFCGYSGENTLASEIKRGAKAIKIDGELISNNAQIYCLNTFSSHANYEQLMSYYSKIKYDKLCVVHSEFSTKVTFCDELHNRLVKDGDSAKIVCVNEDAKIYL